MNKGIIAPAEPLSADGLAVEQQLTARVLSSPSYSSHITSTSAASAAISGTVKKGSAAQRAARHKAEQARIAQAALRAFIASVRVPRFDAAVLMNLEDLEDCDKIHGERDVNDVCLESDGSDAVSMESSTLDAPSESDSQNSSNSSTQQSQELVSGVKEVRITPGPCSNGECGENSEGEEEEEDNEQEEDMGLTSEQYLYVVAALCQVRLFNNAIPHVIIEVENKAICLC